MFLITKDHADRLRLTLPILLSGCDHLHVLDSSTNGSTEALCRSAANPGLVYHGRQEQTTFIARNQVLVRAMEDGFITAFDTDCWDIWSKRNYALLFAAMHGLSRILLIDDDVIPSEGLIGRVLAHLGPHHLVGSRVRGMRDVSVVGHILDLCGEPPQDFVSGHFLAVEVTAASRFFFPPLYNEDWVFVLLNSLSGTVARCGSIFQLYWNPFDDASGRAAFEEEGEILAEAVGRACLHDGGVEALSSAEHWNAALELRQQLLDGLAASHPVRSAPVLRTILESSRAYVRSAEPEHFLGLWNLYLARLDTWRSLVDACRS